MSLLKPVTLFSLLFIMEYGCTSFSKAARETRRLELSSMRQNGKAHPGILGYWKSIGSGYILEVKADTILLYSYTAHFCYKEKNDYIESLLNTQTRFTLTKDTLSVYMADYGENTSHLQIKNNYIRINGLPTGTMTFSEMQRLGPKLLFQLFIETLKENYAFSQERNLDWEKINDTLGIKVTDSTTESELFQIMGAVVTLTKDHHTKIIDEKGQALQYRGTKSAEIVSEVFKNQTEIKNLNDYFNLFFKTNYSNISDSLLHGRGKKLGNGQIEYGSLNERIGYISIYSFSNFTKTNRKQQIDSLNNYFTQIITELKNKEAIIIDISFNFGGYDATVFTIAGYFTDKVRLAYTSQVYMDNKFYNESQVYIHPAKSITYIKPVYVLMSDIRRSAAEGFAMTMKSFPQVKLAGTNTMGILSSMLGKSIGTFYSTSSNQRLLSPTGQFYEVTGVEPDIKLKIFSKENIFGGHKDAVRKIMTMIN